MSTKPLLFNFFFCLRNHFFFLLLLFIVQFLSYPLSSHFCISSRSRCFRCIRFWFVDKVKWDFPNSTWIFLWMRTPHSFSLFNLRFFVHWERMHQKMTDSFNKMKSGNRNSCLRYWNRLKMQLQSEQTLNGTLRNAVIFHLNYFL